MKKLNLIFGVLVIVFFAACEVSQVNDQSELAESAKNHADMSSEFNMIYEFVNSVGTEDPGLAGKSDYGFLPNCATASIDYQNMALEVDFGDNGCTCKDGISRKGKIRATFDGHYRTAGTTVTVTLEDYYVNDIEFTGTKTITNLGNQSGNYKYSYEVENATATFLFGTLIWNTSATIERVEGDNTSQIWDDVYEITGSSYGTNAYGNTYEVTTEEPLVKINNIDCLRNFVTGVLILTDSKGNHIRFNYDPIGAGKCDKTAEIVINDGEPYIINLR